MELKRAANVRPILIKNSLRQLGLAFSSVMETPSLLTISGPELLSFDFKGNIFFK